MKFQSAGHVTSKLDEHRRRVSVDEPYVELVLITPGGTVRRVEMTPGEALGAAEQLLRAARRAMGE